MSDKSVFLKPNVVIEPLINKWYAWSHLISPATSALHLTGRYLEILNSYIESPDLHKEAVKNPKMLGGPFIDYETDRSAEIKDLLESTLSKQSKLIDLSFAIKKLNKILKSNAKGNSLESLYEKVPEIIKGYVELVYDLNNNPSFKFYEQLLYKSTFYDETQQSISIWLTTNDARPFCLSTPRLNEKNIINLKLPFKSTSIDELSEMKRKCKSLNQIKEILKIEKEDEEMFESFFTSEEPSSYKGYNGDKIRMRYFGHACILIETSNVSILIDPLISYYGYNSDINHYSDYDLPDKIDYVLITHNHQDHILLETLLPLRHKIKNLIVPKASIGALQDPSLKLMFNIIGFNNVSEISDMESIIFQDCEITGIPFTGEHSDLDIKSKTCYYIKISGFTLLFIADSRVLEHKIYNHVQKIIGNVDVMFLGMECDGAPLSWLYGPLMQEEISKEYDQSRRLSGSDFTKGMQLVNIFNPSEVYVYAMGQEPWCEFISSIKYDDKSNPIIQSNLLIDECRKKGIISERLFGEKEILYNKKNLIN